MASCKSLVTAGTTDDRNAVPGPVLRDLAERTVTSFEDCQTIRDLLLKRLGSASADVKYKVLHCIKYIATHGRGEFGMSLRRNQAIKDCLQFRGKYDPLRGDTPNERVRETAKEAMVALFAQPQPLRSGSAASGVSQQRIQGFGNDPVEQPAPASVFNGGIQARNGGASGYSQQQQQQQQQQQNSQAGGSALPHEHYDAEGRPLKLESGAYSSGKMVGFGNTPQPQESAGSQFFQKMKTKVMQAASGSSQRPSGGAGFPDHPSPRFNNPSSHGPSSGVSASDIYRAHAEQAGTAPAASQANPSRQRRRGAVGGDWDEEDSAPAPARSNGQDPQQQQQSAAWDNPSPQSQAVEAALRQSNGEHEARLVEKFTAPSGVRVLPRTPDLREFLEVTKRLDHSMIAQLLTQNFVSEDLSTRMKSITYLLALLDSGSEPAEDHLLDHPELIQDFYARTQTEFQLSVGAPVSGVNYVKVLLERIEKCLTLIGLQSLIVVSSPTPQNHFQQQQVQVAASGFDFLGDSSPQTAADSSGGQSLFDGLNSGPTAADSAAADDDLLMFDLGSTSGADIAQPTPSNPASQGFDVLFDSPASGFDFVSSSPAPVGPSASGLFDELHFPSHTANVSADQMPSLLDQLNLGGDHPAPAQLTPLDLYGAPHQKQQQQQQQPQQQLFNGAGATGLEFLVSSQPAAKPAPMFLDAFGGAPASSDPFAFIDHSRPAAPVLPSATAAAPASKANPDSFDFVKDMML